MSDYLMITTGSGGDDGDGCGGKRKRTEGTEDSFDEYVDANTLRDRLRAAELGLALALQNVEDKRKQLEYIREQIRFNENYKADSLLRLSDGGDNHILHHIMSYLDMKDFGPCAIVCRTLNYQTTKCWKAFDAKLLIHDSLRSPSAQSCLQRVVRYHNASTLARQIGAMGDNLSRHAVIDVGEGDYHYTRVEDHCLGCSLPDLNFDVFHGPGVLSDDYELFVRFSRTSDSKLLAEGFTSFNRAGGDLSLDDLDLSNWTELLEISRLAVLHGDQFGKEDHHMDPLCECMQNLTAVVVAVNKSTAKACLVAAQNDFGGGDPPSDRNRSYSIGIIAREGYCWPRGYLSRCTHGRVDTDRLINLGMLFEILQDPEECQWLLHCTWYDDD